MAPLRVSQLRVAVEPPSDEEINRALASPEIANHIATNGLVAGGGAPEDVAAFLKRDKAIWTKVIATGGIKAE